MACVLPFPTAEPVPDDAMERADDGSLPADVIPLHDFTRRAGRNRFPAVTPVPGPSAA